MFKALKGLVFTEDAPVIPTPAPVQQNRPMSMTPNIEMMPVDSVLDTTTILASIIGIIEQEPGFANYARFAATSTALEKVILIEGTRLQASQATTGLTRDQLLESLATYQGVLTNETANFQAHFINSAEQSIQALNEQSTALADQIQQLTGQLAEVSNQKEALISDALTKSSELAKAKIDFNSVVQTITNRYADVATKLQQYLSA